MKFSKILGLAAVSACLTISTSATASEQNDMNRVASALTKLSSAVEATVRYRRPSTLLSSRELLMLSTAHDTKLLEPFAPYKVQIFRDRDKVTLLVCEVRRDRALLEDRACTARLDQHHWSSSSTASCAFTLMTFDDCGN
jgi:hypothetical protein